MTDPQDLARRYLALWEEYLTAVLTDPADAPPLWGWAFGRLQPDEQGRDPGSAGGAAPAAGSFDHRVWSVAELAHRLAGGCVRNICADR